MSRSAHDRTADILDAIDRCIAYRPYIDDAKHELASMAYDAVLRNLAVIGEAVRALPADITDALPQVPWASIAGLRNVVVHEYFRVQPALILGIVDEQLLSLARALCGRRDSSDISPALLGESRPAAGSITSSTPPATPGSPTP